MGGEKTKDITEQVNILHTMAFKTRNLLTLTDDAKEEMLEHIYSMIRILEENI